ncbi:MAG TPA: hypothetical protein VFQ91_27465 [Bryobacteraceae bacterium]|nr:hypothetical protein [Bryobacteraceae bacterium]
MPESYFEDADITIDASGESMKAKKFLRTTPYTGPVTITVSKVEPSKVLTTKTVNATKGKFDAPVTFKAPAVEKTEEFYELQVKATYKKVTKLLLTATIWPKTTQVLFLDQGKQPQKAFAFLVKQKGEPDQNLATDDKGKCTATLMSRGPYSIAPAGKFKLLEDKQATAGQYRDHQITIETVITAKFLAPDISQDIYIDDPDAAPAKKQWINLPSKEEEHEINSGCDAKGNCIVFAVTADPPEDGQPGDKVYFEINFGKESKRNTPPPKLTDTFPVHEKKTVEKKTTGWVALAPLGDVATGYFEVDLGMAGGDTCEVKIGGTPAVADSKLKLINWRKIYAQITKTAEITAPGLASAIECLKKTCIDLEESVADNVNLTSSAVPGGAIVDEAVITGSGSGKLLIVGTHNKSWFEDQLKARFASEKLPVAHIIFCHYQLDAGNTAEGSANLKGKKNGQTQDTIAFPGGGTAPGLSITGAATTGNSDGFYFTKDLSDGSDAVKYCRWKEVGGTNASGDIDAADYKLEYKKSVGNELFIRLPAAAKLLSDGGATITVEYKVAWAEGNNLGWCTRDRRHNVIATVGRTAKQMCGTIVHEIGHAIGQSARDANKGDFPGLPAPPHARWYTNSRGHSGNHCADGVSDTYYNNQSNKMTASAATSVCTCIMFGSGTDKRNETLAFCAKCLPYVKAYKITTVST